MPLRGKAPDARLASINITLSIYQWVISPVIHTLAGPGYGCRFQPTCSEYSKQAFGSFSFFKALWISIKRLSRCNPFGGCGYDPLPVISSTSISKFRDVNPR